MENLDWETGTAGDWGPVLENEFDSLLQRTGAANKDYPKAQVVERVGQAEILSWKPRQILTHINSPAGMKVRILQFYYPGWLATRLDTLEPLDLRPSQPDGLLSLEVPAGDFDVSIQLGKTDAERIGQNITLVSILCLLLYVLALGPVKEAWRSS